MVEFAFNRLKRLTQVREVAVVEAPAARQLPNTRDRVRLWAAGGKVIKREAIGGLLPPIPV